MMSHTSTNSLAAFPTRRTFSIRSAAVKPRSRLSRDRCVAVQDVGVPAIGE